ncbi:alpha/beta hydrolase [Micromonospora sp. NPDC049559]|uniref:alpha/beta fold hydrolase n=1 Tax=Micromonospora sp. NPDC049559 TaxID=3155923 RepID=UPI00343A3BD3
MTKHGSRDQEIVSADGTRLVIRRVGSGDPVLLLHGSGGGLHSWAAVADLLADDHELWLLARRGYGPSDVPPGPKSFADEVGDLRAVLAAIRGPSGRRVHLVGASYGAILALHTAAANLPELRSLAVFEAPFFAAGERVLPLLDRYRDALGRGDSRAATAVLNELTLTPAEIIARFEAAMAGREPDPAEQRRSGIGWLHDLEALAADSTETARWSSITLPTLIMQGAETWEPMPSTMEGLAKAIPHARRVVWEGQTHFVTSTAPGLVADALREFFAEVPA